MKLTESQFATAKIIIANPGECEEDIIQRGMAGWSRKRLKEAIKSLLHRELVEEIDGMLCVKDELRELLREGVKPEVVQPYTRPFLPMSSRFLLPTISPRGEPLRQSSFISMSSKVRDEFKRAGDL